MVIVPIDQGLSIKVHEGQIYPEEKRKYRLRGATVFNDRKKAYFEPEKQGQHFKAHNGKPGMKPHRPRSASQIADIANSLVDPILAKRSGISTSLLNAWEEIAGESYAAFSRPESINWPRRNEGMEDGSFRPGALTIACEGARVLFLTHAKDELIHRVNGFFGFIAIDRIRIVQKPIQPRTARHPPRPQLTLTEKKALERKLDGIESEELRRAILRLGTGVLTEKRKKASKRQSS